MALSYRSDNRGVNTIPQILRAKTFKALQRLMRRNNLRLKAGVTYTILIHPKTGYYEATWDENEDIFTGVN